MARVVRLYKVILVGAGIALAAAAGLPAWGVVPASASVGAASSWAWKVVLGLVVLYVVVQSILARRNGGLVSAVDGRVDDLTPPPPLSKQPVPDLPAPFIAHPHVLPEHFAGRFREREALTNWFKKKRSRPVHVLVGPGGVGKSALACVWLQRDLLGRDLPHVGSDPPDVQQACRVAPRSRPEGIIWWSFDQPGAGFTVFLDEAMSYLSGGGVRTSDYLSSRSQKVESLLGYLRDHRCLLILDGFERELRAFSSLQADYRGDRHPRGKHGEERVCTDLHGAEFLRRLSTEPLEGRVLITSKLLPWELGDLDSADDLRRELRGLDEVDGVALMQSMGVKGEAEKIKSVCRPFDYHPLGLRLVAGAVKKRRENGRIHEAPRIPDAAEGRAHHAVVKAAYDALRRDAQRVLSHIAAFRRPVTAEQVAIVNPLGKTGPWPDVLKELVMRSLLIYDDQADRFGMHPIVRHHAYAQLPDPSALHKRLADHFSQVRPPVQVTSLGDLEPALELYHHLIGAERYDEACALLQDKISATLRDRLANQQMHMRLLRGLFDPAHGTKPLLRKKPERIWAINALARAYSYSGETRRAASLCEQNLPGLEGKGDRQDLLALLGNLAGVQSRLGRMEAAEGTLRRLVALSGELELRIEEAIARNRLGLLLAHRGAFDESLAELDAAFEATKETSDRQTQGVAFSYYAQRSLLMGDAEAARDAAQKARAFVEDIARREEPDEHDFVRSGWLLAASLIALADADGEDKRTRRADAERYLTDSLARCQRADLVGFMPDLLLTLAKWHHSCGKTRDAQQSANDALALADRCEYRLKQAEIHNFLARLAVESGDKNEARRHAKVARERATCDGLPHAYQPALERAQKQLAELGEHGPGEAATQAA